ncbi:MAG: hypothetical protein K2P07_13615 [Lachnospiraceae bacterium]|nr:hypothetical protein [Lachnospiraceae bacterium]
MEGLYWQPEHTIDVMMMGSSHIHCNVNTALLWEKYGIAAYDYSGAEQPLWMTYHYLKELYKYQSPEVIVLDLYAPARYKEDYQYDWISENIFGMRFSLNKLEMMAVSVEKSKFFQYFPSFTVYHSRYDNLEEDDFSNFFWNSGEKEDFKGYTPYWKRTPQIRTEVTETRKDGLTEKSELYLRKIIKYVKDKDSELVLMAAPYVMTGEDMRTFNKIAEIADEEGILFVNFNHMYEKIGLDFLEDFNDESHLNYWGGCKFTDFLGEFLNSYYSLPDRRGQEGYGSWDDHVKMIEDELRNYEGCF